MTPSLKRTLQYIASLRAYLEIILKALVIKIKKSYKALRRFVLGFVRSSLGDDASNIFRRPFCLLGMKLKKIIIASYLFPS